MKDYPNRLLDFVGQSIRAGKTKEDILKEKAIPGLTGWQGDGIEWGLQAAYEEITAG